MSNRRAEEALARMSGESKKRKQLAVFVGSGLSNLAARVSEEDGDQVIAEQSFEKARLSLEVASNDLREQVRKAMVVVETGAEIGAFGPALRMLVAPVERTVLPDVRTVVVGEATIQDFGLIVDLLWSHVVDWLPGDVDETAAIERLRRAWSRKSLRIETLGMGLRTGAPQHVLAHHATRIQNLIEPMRLAHLPTEALFQASIRGDEGPQDEPFEREMVDEFELRWRLDRGHWEESYGISKEDIARLLESGLNSAHGSQLAPRLWAAYLAEVVSGIADMTYKDHRELAEYLERVRNDYFYRESGHG